MLLESLRDPRFKTFEQDILKNPLSIVGGLISKTTYTDYNSDWEPIHSGTDSWRTGEDIFSDSQLMYLKNQGERGELLILSIDGGPAEPQPYYPIFEEQHWMASFPDGEHEEDEVLPAEEP